MPKTIKIVTTKEQFLKMFLNDLPGGGLFIETEELYGLGDSVELNLEIAGLAESFVLLGVVAWHRRPRAWSSSLPSGIGFQFLVEDESKITFLLDFAKGKAVNRRFTGARKSVNYETKIKIHDTWVCAKTVNVGSGGLRIVTDEKIERGVVMQCVVYTDDENPPIECTAEVVRAEKTGEHYVAGLRFLKVNPLARKTFNSVPAPKAEPKEKRAQQIIRRNTIPPPPSGSSINNSRETIKILKD